MGRIHNDITRLSKALSFALSASSGLTAPSAREIDDAVETVRDIVREANSNWGEGALLVGAASTFAYQVESHLENLRQILGLMPELWKTGVLTSITDLKNAIKKEGLEFSDSTGEALMLEDLMKMYFEHTVRPSPGEVARVSALERLIDSAGTSRRMFATLNPNSKPYAEYDAGRDSKFHSLVPVGGGVHFVRLTDAAVPPTVPLGQVTQTSADSQFAIVSGIPIGAQLVRIRGPALLEVSVTVLLPDAVYGVGKDTATNIPVTLDVANTSTAATRLTALQAVTFGGAAASSTLIDTYAAASAVTGIFMVYASAAGDVTITYPVCAVANEMLVYHSDIRSVHRSTNEAPGAVLGAQADLESQIGNLPLSVLERSDFKIASSRLREIERFDRWVLSGNYSLMEDRDMRSVLSKYSTSKLGVAVTFSEDDDLFDIAYWISGRAVCPAGAFNQTQWKKLYNQFYDVLHVYEAAMLANTDFASELAFNKVGVNV